VRSAITKLKHNIGLSASYSRETFVPCLLNGGKTPKEVWDVADNHCRLQRLKDWDEVHDMDNHKQRKKAIKVKSNSVDWEVRGEDLVRAVDPDFAAQVDVMLAGHLRSGLLSAPEAPRTPPLWDEYFDWNCKTKPFDELVKWAKEVHAEVRTWQFINAYGSWDHG
jgi:hypothetical protein